MPLTLRESIIKRPGMYFGDVEQNGANLIIYELMANVIDLHLAGLASSIYIEIDENNINVSDDGPGMPFNKQFDTNKNLSLVEHYLTHHHDTPTADQHAPHIHVISNGLGLAFLNAASDKLLIESHDGMTKTTQLFGGGKIQTPAEHQDDRDKSGTTISITLDKKIFKKNYINRNELKTVLFDVAHLYPGINISFEKNRFCFQHGLLDYANILIKRPDNSVQLKTFWENDAINDMTYQVALLGDANKNMQIRSWVNGRMTTDDGTHVDALKIACKRNEWTPQVALIHLIMHNPNYAGPTKDSLKIPEIKGLLANELTQKIKEKLSFM